MLTPISAILAGDATSGLLAPSRGSLPFRGASHWDALAPGTAGLPLLSGGAGADPSYAALAQSNVSGLSASLAAKADDNAVVKLTGDQTVAGVKTFSSLPVLGSLSGLVKAASGSLSAGVAGTDYLAPTGNGSGLTALNASNLGSGTVPVARLGDSGTRDNTTILYGDNVFRTAPSGGVTDHGSLTGLTGTDHHTQYALLAGRSGGQTLIGGTASGNNLALQSTSHATKGVVSSDSPIRTVVGTTAAVAIGPNATYGINFTGVGGTGNPRFVSAGTEIVEFNYGIGGQQIKSDTYLMWGSGALGTTPDLVLNRTAPGVLRANTGTGLAGGWFQNAGGRAITTADATNATATLANLSGLSITVAAGRKYTFRATLYVANSVPGEGVTIDFDGGTATMTAFRAHTRITDSALLLSTETTAIATDVTVATVTGDAIVEVQGSFTVNAAGTFVVRFAEASHTSGTLTAYRGSHIWAEDMP